MNYANDLRKQIHDTALAIGMPILSDDKCCRLLAWLLVHGGGCEATVLNDRLRHDIQYAQKRLNIFGGEVPNAELVPQFQDYVKSMGGEYRPLEKQPDWVLELEKDYGIRRSV